MQRQTHKQKQSHSSGCHGDVSWIYDNGFHTVNLAKSDSGMSNPTLPNTCCPNSSWPEKHFHELSSISRKSPAHQDLGVIPLFSDLQNQIQHRPINTFPKIFNMSSLIYFFFFLYSCSHEQEARTQQTLYLSSVLFFCSDCLETEQVHWTTFPFSSTVFAQVTLNIYYRLFFLIMVQWCDHVYL